MNHRNTLNTRLLPLSILISSLVSGGAMAASTSTFTPGATLGMGNGGSFIVTTNTKAPEDILLESLFPEDQSITAEMITQAKSQIATMQQNNQKQTQDIEASIANLTTAQQKIAQKELDSFKDIFEKKINQLAAVVAYAEDKTEDNKNKLNAAAKDAFVTTINAQAPGQFTAEEVNSLFNAALTNDNSAISLELEQKATAVKQQQQASQNTLTKVQNYLIQGVISQEQKEKLAAYFAEKQAKFNELAVAKQAEEEAKKVNTKAKADAAILNVKSVLLKTSVENAGKEKKQAEDNLKQLDTDKNTVIEAVDPNWNANTPDLDKKLQELIDNPNTLQDKIKEAKEAKEAIKKANTAKLLVDDATKKHQSADVAFNNNELKVTAANQIKTDAAAKLATSTTEMNNATAALSNLETVTTTTVDIPAFEQKIASAEQQKVATGTFALDTQVSGGTQNVEKGGEIIGSIISEDGTVNLALGALANSTVITKGIMENNGGTDMNTVIGAEGQLTLTGKNDTERAISEGAIVAKGGQITAAEYSVVSDLVSEGDITAKDNAIISKAIIKGGSLTLQNKTIAMDTTLNGGVFTLKTDTAAIRTTVNGGKFIVNDGATAEHTELNNSHFKLAGSANAQHTTVNNGAEFIVSGNAKADNTTVNGGIFNLKSRMQANKILVEDGYALIASSLKDAELNGGTTIFTQTAAVEGTINANKGSFLSVHDGAVTQHADLNLAGNMVFVAEDAPYVRLHPTSRAAFSAMNGKPAKFAFKDVTLAGGSIDMSQTKAQLTMNALAGNGSFNLGSALHSHTTAPLNVTGDAAGAFNVQIDASGVAPANLSIVDVKGTNNARFALSNGPVNLGNYKHNLVSDGKGGFKLVADKTALTPGAAGILAVANTTPTIFNAELSSIQNRLDKQSASANESGVWLTYLNDNYDVKGTATNFKQKLNGMTLGGDKAMELGEAVFSIGAFASHSSSNIKSDYQSSGSVESNSLGAYAQYLANSGYYLNGVMKTNQFKQNLNVTAKGSNASGNANFSGLGLAVKAGKHITIDELYVSPFVAMSSFTSGKSQYQLSNGMEAQSQGARTTTGTIGMNTGYRFVLNSGAEIKPYAIFSVDHDLMAKNDVVINNEMFDNSLKGTRANAGVGVNVNLTSNLSVGSEVKVSKGKNIATPMTINMGVAYTF
ncbi:TPA: autotransporter outer membrane beta-barrel domain-containing protein [Yersinia enterocolitica]|uniref:autotransporter outer membrane beta-barrel domain-containing protein n=1 Tax=Yersinia enterocolitica TaxID=630 RepID=UPI0028B7682B|nr:autotransporter outer membrane beta-barrel domain-containing protein [Yersinia enterocolitica]ELI8003136.1 autotransporter outer membrane beta-barrel domain-containing protein [Yersinia enterocolitica]ELX2214584.1 autotransporter outer membrane beta-barrel domain-containing protein [Yersinia enterocolitica]HEB1856974.1 autotransporter outer membrane beta-barrel domain-containing protein [Yersinia enterocolitica]HEF7234214.1 autotransporter outer membrane beta-barrel domain-containing protein